MGLRVGHVSISVWSDIASQDFCGDCTKDWVLSDVDPREGLDPTHLPTATWNGFAHAQVASCRCTETSSHGGTPGHWSSRHAPNDAETPRCSCVARDRPSWDARIDTWNAKDAWGSGQIGPTVKIWLWGCGEPAWLEDGKKRSKYTNFVVTGPTICGKTTICGKSNRIALSNWKSLLHASVCRFESLERL